MINLMEHLPMRTAEDLFAEKVWDVVDIFGMEADDVMTVVLSGTDEQRKQLGFHDLDVLACRALRGDTEAHEQLQHMSIDEYIHFDDDEGEEV